MQVAKPVAITLDSLPQTFRHAAVGIHVQQNGAGIPDQGIRPTRDYTSTNNASHWVHPQPTEGSGEQKARDDQHRNCGIGYYMNYGCAHIVVALCRTMSVLVLL